MKERLLTPKAFIPVIFSILMLGCSAISCLGSASILVPRAADSLPTSVLIFSIFLIIAAPVLLVVGVGAITYFGFIRENNEEGE